MVVCNSRVKIGLVAVGLVLLAWGVSVLLLSRTHHTVVPKVSSGWLQPADIERLRLDFEKQCSIAYSSVPDKVNSLEDVARLNVERAKEFRRNWSDLVKHARHYHEFYMRPRPPHEVEVILQALEDATGRTPWDMEKIEAACDEAKYGIYDIRVLEKLKKIVATLQAKYSEPEIGEANGLVSQEKNSALGDAEDVLRSIGYIGLPESAEYLLSLIPGELALIDTRWERTVVYGAYYGLGSLPSHLAIPALEALYHRWFPNVPPDAIMLEDIQAQGTFESVLQLIDGAYRKAYREIPLIPHGYLPGKGGYEDWPLPKYRYGPGGIKLPWSPEDKILRVLD